MWAVFAIFCALVLVATTFISHTVGAMVILPIVSAVGTQMEVRCWSGFAYYGMVWHVAQHTEFFHMEVLT